MIFLSVLLVAIILIVLIGVCTILLGGISFVTVFGDLIVGIAIIWLIIRAIVRHHKKKQNKNDI